MNTQNTTVQTETYEERIDAIGDFLKLLFHTNSPRPIRIDELESTSIAWEIALRDVRSKYLADRSEGSLIELCTQRGFFRASQVLEIFRATVGAEEFQASQRLAQQQRSAERSEVAGVGEGHQMLMDYVASRHLAVPA